MKKFVMGLLATILIVGLTLPVSAYASDKSKIKKLVGCMEAFEFMVFTSNYVDENGEFETDFDDAMMAKAAALSVSLKDAKIAGHDPDSYSDDYMWVEYAISSKKIKKASKNIFGKSVSYKKLFMNEYFTFLDAYLNEKGKPVVYVWQWETETDYVVRDISIKKVSDKKYTVTKKIFCGYWGLNKDGKANYAVTYNVEKNSKSKYGFVITSMKVTEP